MFNPLGFISKFIKSGNQKETLAQYNMGTFYYMGRGVEQSYKKALEWFKKAAGAVALQSEITSLNDKIGDMLPIQEHEDILNTHIGSIREEHETLIKTQKEKAQVEVDELKEELK